MPFQPLFLIFTYEQANTIAGLKPRVGPSCEANTSSKFTNVYVLNVLGEPCLIRNFVVTHNTLGGGDWRSMCHLYVLVKHILGSKHLSTGDTAVQGMFYCIMPQVIPKISVIIMS